MAGVEPDFSFQLEQRGSGTRVKLRGILDESLANSGLADALRHERAIVIFDLDLIRRITSFGVREWMRGLQRLNAGYYGFINCRPAIVAQFNMIANFGATGQLITFYAPYLCPSCSTDFEVLIDLRKRPAAQLTAGPQQEPCPKCGAPADLDDLPESYFSYVVSIPALSLPAAAAALVDDVDAAGPAVHPLQVEKEIAGNLTALWLSGTIDKVGSLRRVVDGLEGQVLVLLEGVEGITEAGAKEFTRLFTQQEAEIVLARVPRTLLGALSAMPWGKAKIASMRVVCRCENCGVERQADLNHELIGSIQNLPPTLRCFGCGAGPLRAPALTPAELKLPFVDKLSSVFDEYLRGHAVAPRRAAQTPTAPTLSGRYEIERRIGMGGMAEVFLAKHQGPEGFAKEVVIKRIRPMYSADRQFTDMFLREAKLAAKINHSNVVQIFELGRDGDEFFIAMELVLGWDLNFLLKMASEMRVQMPIELACRIVGDICGGLHAAHELSEDGIPLGIIHRDVSPHNVLISKEGAVKVTDFGVAKAAASLTDDNATNSGQLKGKISYLSPEQLFPTNRPVDRRADIFATGIIFYQCLTGKHPFRKSSDFETMQAIMADPAPSISGQRADASPALDLILQRSLAKDPAERFATASDLQLQVEQFIATSGKLASHGKLAIWASDLMAAASKTDRGAKLLEEHESSGPLLVQQNDILEVAPDGSSPTASRAKSRG